MVQNILVYTIVLATLTYVAYTMIKSLSTKAKKSICAGCSGCGLTTVKKKCC